MKPRLLFAALALLLLVGALLVFVMGEDPTPSRPARRAPAAAPAAHETTKGTGARRRPRKGPKPAAPRPATGAAPDADTRGDAPVEKGARPVASPLQHRVKVTVTDASGGRAHRATVRLVDAFAHHTGFERTGDLDSADTDAEGEAELAAPLHAAVLVLAERDGDAAVAPRIDAPRGATEDLESSVSLRLEPGFGLRGRVVDPAGAGVSRALATLRLAWFDDPVGVGLSLHTGEDGAFRFPSVPASGIAQPVAIVTVRAEGYVPVQLTVRTDEPRPDGLRVQLERGAVVRGRCVTPDGDPVARVSVYLADGSSRADSSPDGRFRIDGVPSAGGGLVILPSRLAPQRVEIAADAGEVDLGDVVLRPGGTVRGVVVDGEGKPQEGANVEASLESVAEGYRSARSDAEGRFELTGLADGTHTVFATWRSIRAPEIGEAARADGVTPDGPEIRLVMTSPRTVLVRFLEESDRSPVAVNDVKVTATPAAAGEEPVGWAWAGSGLRTVRCRFEIAGVYDLQIEIPGYSLGEVTGVEVRDDRGVEIDVLFRRREE